jgi:hypothetical protein
MKIGSVKKYIMEIYNRDWFYRGAYANDGQTSILLIGSSGIGKSTAPFEAAMEIARELELEFVIYDDSRAEEILRNPDKYYVFVDLNLNQLEPSDLSGIPREVKITLGDNETVEGVQYVPFLWALCLSRAAGMLFLDEITNVQRLDVITAAYKVVLDRRSGFTQFCDGVMVVGAGNPPSESSAANLLPNPIANRFIIRYVDPAEIDGWAEWMDEHFSDRWDVRVLAYLNYFPIDFLKIPSETETLTNFPTQRSWSELSLLLKRINPQMWHDTAVGKIGPEAGDRLNAFLNIEVPDIERLFASPRDFVNLGMEQRYLASVFVGSFLKNRLSDSSIGNGREHDEEVAKAIPLLEVMGGEQRDFVVLSVMSCGEHRFRVVNNLTRSSRSMNELFSEVNALREQIEV